MALPTNKAEFKKFVLRQLGAGAKRINVTDEQIDDCVEMALSYYADYHFDATDKIYFTHKITDTDRTNKYIDLPEEIIGVVQMFPIGDAMSTQNMFSIKYQIALNDLYNLTNLTLVPFYSAMQYVEMIEQILVGRQPIRFARHMNRCYIDMDWDKLPVDTYVVLECYQVIDPTVYPNVWKDRWLINYAVQLVKRQWGNNMKVYGGVQLLNGVTLNGQQIYDEAEAEILRMEDEMINKYSMPLSDMIG